MEFFDKKEEVIDIELTQHGKRLVSQGIFKPTHYAFFDDDILYDTRFAGFEEHQNSADPRIRVNTPSTKTQYHYSGLMEEMQKHKKKHNQYKSWGKDPEPLQNTLERIYAQSKYLGNCHMATSSAPAWDVRLFGNVIDTIDTTMALVTTPENPLKSSKILRIPQLNLKIDYTIVKKITEGEPSSLFVNEPGLENILKFFDEEVGIEYEIRRDHVLLKIEEKNAEFTKENFDIEVFEVESYGLAKFFDSNNNAVVSYGQHLHPLYFYAPFGAQGGDVPKTYQEETQLSGMNVSDIDPSYVGYYLDIKVDSEIDDELYCKYFAQNQIKGIFSDLTFDCPDIAVKDVGVYKEIEHDGEICD